VKNIIFSIFADNDRAKQFFLRENVVVLEEIILCLVKVFNRGNKLLLCGNGGSAADAQHLAAEFVNRFLIERKPLPALALTTDSSVLTSISNDYAYNDVFSKQVQALGQAGDALIGISTSGTSQNVISALHTAKEKNIVTIGFGGKADGEMAAHCDYYLPVYGVPTPRVQEIHILAAHTIVEIIDEILFGKLQDKL